ncbi:MAG: hydrogen gas-evolving membrane-bound hydrogenase subunit E, partial [Halothiobacillus sp.]
EPSPDLPTHIHEPPLMMRIPVMILVVACLAVGLAPALLVGGILNLSVSAALNAPAPIFSLALWHGFNTPLIMSMLAMFGGLVVYLARRPLTRWHEQSLGRLNAKTPYNFVLRALQLGSETLTHAFDQGRLQPMVFWTLTTTLAAGLIGFLHFSAAPLFGSDPQATPFDGITALGIIIMMGLALSIAFIHAQRLIALLVLSVIGLGVSLLFVRYSAPDLALTQLSVEVVTLILMLLALRYLPQTSPPDRAKRRRLDAFLASLIGAGAATLTYAMMSRDFASIAGYFLENSLSQGGGHNVVNVILVDFRGYDTFGEISVLALAALGIYALLQGIKLPPLTPPPIATARLAHPMLLQTASQLLLPMTLLFGAYILLRGHNAPGGGFIAGLIVASAILLQLIAYGQPADGRALSAKAHGAIALGLLLALGTGLASIVLGYPFLT